MRFPEEIELAKKREELAELLEEQTRRERELSSIKSEIRTFERMYEQALGARISELEQLEWEIGGLLGNDEGEEFQKYYYASDNGSSRHHSCKTSLLDDDPQISSIIEEKNLKTLYREVAKSIHPDLATADSERCRRQELMATANLAYEEGNRAALHRILREWQLGPEMTSGIDVGVELVRIIRQIAYIKETIQEIRDQLSELLESDIYRFKHRVDRAAGDGIDLLAEMVATVDLDIAKARKRLALLKGEEELPDENGCSHPGTRVVRFPSENSCGLLYVRSINSVDYRDWQKLGQARGIREIPLDKSLRLDMRGDGTYGTALLKTLGPNDLQALFLYDVGPDALPRLLHLSGLKELYLSNTTIDDGNLHQIASLTGLRRLYIYHTEISDSALPGLFTMKWLKWLTFSGTMVTEEGLEVLRRELPGCKVISFKWHK